MKYKKSKAIGKTGVAYIEKVINDQGSIFRPVHEEDDVGIDGFMEIVTNEIASGRLIAMQIKSGDSYLKNRDSFEVIIDDRHLQYWKDFMVPVILVCYSPKANMAAWISIREYIQHETYHGRLPIKKISVPTYRKFDVKTISTEIAGLAHVRADERILLKCADMCLSKDSETRHRGFQILANHPDSRSLKITCFIAKQLILDERIETAKDALHVLGFGVGRRRWSWNPNNLEEREIIDYACSLCSDISQNEFERLLELVDDESFHGPQGLGERLLDITGCCYDTAYEVLDSVIYDKSKPIQRRANALYLRYECNDDYLEEALDELRKDPCTEEIVNWMFDDPKQE